MASGFIHVSKKDPIPDTKIFIDRFLLISGTDGAKFNQF